MKNNITQYIMIISILTSYANPLKFKIITVLKQAKLSMSQGKRSEISMS